MEQVKPEDRYRLWIGRIAQGDQNALSELYDHTSRFVYGVALRILADTGAAEEATLDVYLQVWRQAHSYDASRGDPSAWLLTLARSRAIDRLRVAARARRQDEALTTAPVSAHVSDDPERASAFAERRRRIREALAQLPSDQRHAIEIAFVEGLSHSEIAEKLGQPLGTVKTRIRSGMIKLRELLESLREGN